MREFAKTEIFRYKCPICGSNNKKMIPIMWKKVPYGFTLHCCNCGHIEEFIKPSKHIGGLYNGHFEAGEEKYQRCYMLNECPHTRCPLYGTYKPDEDSGYDDEQSGDGTYPGPDQNPDDGDKDKVYLGVYGNDNSDEEELKVKVVTHEPKFR